MPNTFEKAASKTMGAMKDVKATFKGLHGVFKTLMEEHGEVSALILRVNSSSDQSVRRELYPTIRKELLAHEKGELATVYPFLAQFPETSDIAVEHHREASELESELSALDHLDVGDPRWDIGFKRLASLVKKHVAEEEGEYFPRAQEAIGEDEAELLKTRYEATKSLIT